MKRIKVGNKFAIIDNEDFDKVNKFKWYYCRGYAVRSSTYKPIHMSTFILGSRKNKDIDYINGKPLDNRKSNLRFCKHSDNLKNVKVHKDNKLGYKRVYFDRGKYRADIMSNGKRYHLGTFNKAKDAALAYDAAALKLNGKFARTNF